MIQITSSTQAGKGGALIPLTIVFEREKENLDPDFVRFMEENAVY